MPRYLSQHTLACLTRQGAEELARRVHAAKEVTARRVLVNMQEGKMLVEFDAPGREELEKWLAAEKFHFAIGCCASNLSPRANRCALCLECGGYCEIRVPALVVRSQIEKLAASLSNVIYSCTPKAIFLDRNVFHPSCVSDRTDDASKTPI